MKLTLGFSPCPNDTFIFDALVNKKIDTEDLEFEPILEDIETLNKWSAEGRLDITKLSFPAFFQNLQQYIALPSGGALGNGVGPLLVAKKTIEPDEINNLRIAIPGEHTTANFLFSFAFPKAKNRFPFIFNNRRNSSKR
jgi:1,4-dihydroxy-6-naphthoate synthase